MGFKAKPLTLLLLFATLIMFSVSALTKEELQFSDSLESFRTNMLQEIFKEAGNDNIAISPFSIQTALGMLRMGVNGESANEMDRVLGFNGQNPQSLAQHFHSMLAMYEQSDIVKFANKVYVMEGQELHANYNDLLSNNFYSSAESVNFSQNQKAAETINHWVESKTNDKVKNLISSDTLDSNTRTVLVNAIHFKGDWQLPFPQENTKQDTFFVKKTENVTVDMMYIRGEFLHYEISALMSQAVQLPFQDSDLSLLIILPYKSTGFGPLKRKLANWRLSSLREYEPWIRLHQLHLPKYKIEFNMDLKKPLRGLGINHIFDTSADLSKMLKTPANLYVSQIVHKAVIEVNERGAEASAATAVEARDRMGPQIFRADHPFYYAIITKDFVPLFEGTVVRP